MPKTANKTTTLLPEKNFECLLVALRDVFFVLITNPDINRPVSPI
jgi:hypothetical protein